MEIVWDEIKRQANLDKHGLDFADLDEAFFGRATIYPTYNNRRLAVGLLRDGTIVVIYSELGTQGLSIISMRYANVRERRLLR